MEPTYKILFMAEMKNFSGDVFIFNADVNVVPTATLLLKIMYIFIYVTILYFKYRALFINVIIYVISFPHTFFCKSNGQKLESYLLCYTGGETRAKIQTR